MKAFIKDIKWFLKYFGTSSHIMGGRTSKISLRWTIKDKDEMNAFLNRFYNECPAMPWLGERTSGEKYYLLKPSWDAFRHILTTIQICKNTPKSSFKYIGWLFDELSHVKSDQKYYMNPTPIRK